MRIELARLIGRKPISDVAGSGAHEVFTLKRSLKARSVLAMGIGAIIGAGIFVLTGTAAAQYAGPSLVISFFIGGVVCCIVGLCYAEMSAMLPVAGSGYTYTYVTLGELVAWIIGWDLILEYALGSATVAVGWSGYAVSLLMDVGIVIPVQLTAAPGAVVKLADGSEVAAIMNLPAGIMVIALTLLLMRGTRNSVQINNIMVVLKLTVVVLFILLGARHVDMGNWTPFIPENEGNFGHYGYSGILRGASIVIFAFLGFDAVSTAAQEALKPQRNMPIGILGSVAICTVLYMLVAAVLTGLVPYKELNVADPISKGVEVIGIGWLSIAIKLGALAGLTTVVLILLFGQTRIFFAMSKDGLLPEIFAHIHPTYQTPYCSQLLIGVLVALMAALLPIDVLAEMVSIGTLFAFTVVCSSVIYLRRAKPDIVRPFRVPGMPVLPLIGIVFCLILMISLPLETWLRLIIWMLIGLGVYAVYGYRRSVLRRGQV